MNGGVPYVCFRALYSAFLNFTRQLKTKDACKSFRQLRFGVAGYLVVNIYMHFFFFWAGFINSQVFETIWSGKWWKIKEKYYICKLRMSKCLGYITNHVIFRGNPHAQLELLHASKMCFVRKSSTAERKEAFKRGSPFFVINWIGGHVFLK